MERPGASFDARSTVVAILGACEFPEANLKGSVAFKHAADSFIEYFLSTNGFGLPEANLIDLFNRRLDPNQLDKQLGDALSIRIASLRNEGVEPSNLIVYYTGHGSFDEKRRYYLALRTTRRENLSVSSLKVENLFITLDRCASEMRRFAIIDACFAGEASFNSQANLEDAVAMQLASLPIAGTTFFCSSSRDSISEFLDDESNTKFAAALCESLWDGDAGLDASLLSIDQLRTLTVRRLRDRELNFIRPEVHNTIQTQEQLDRVPLFPNGPRRMARQLVAEDRFERVKIQAQLEANRAACDRLNHERDLQRHRDDQAAIRARSIELGAIVQASREGHSFDSDEEWHLVEAAEASAPTQVNLVMLSKWAKWTRGRREESALIHEALAEHHRLDAERHDTEALGWLEQANRRSRDGYPADAQFARHRSSIEYEAVRNCRAQSRIELEKAEDEKLAASFLLQLENDMDRIAALAAECLKARVAFATTVGAQVEESLRLLRKRRRQRLVVQRTLIWIRRVLSTLAVLVLVSYCAYLGNKNL